MSTVSKTKNGRLVRWLFVLSFVVMAFSGFGQMPIFKRYYIADIPGMGWAADFYLTHTIHYLGAIFLLGFFAYLITEYLLSARRRSRLTAAGIVRILLLAGLVVTGIVRVLKNLPDVTFSPGVTMFVDIAHLGFMMIFLLAALAFVLTKQKWVTARSDSPS
ncbi:MAG: FeS-binding protein [Desulfobacteraceae bacterium]|jgi:hypothetical protein